MNNFLTVPEVARMFDSPEHAVRRLDAVRDVPRIGSQVRLIARHLLPEIAKQLQQQGYIKAEQPV